MLILSISNSFSLFPFFNDTNVYSTVFEISFQNIFEIAFK